MLARSRRATATISASRSTALARLLAAGHGGQVLVSAVAAELARGSLPVGSSLVGLGPHRLKDFAEPQEIYQLVAPDLAKRISAAAFAGGTPEQPAAADQPPSSAARQKWPRSRRSWKSIGSSRWSARAESARRASSLQVAAEVLDRYRRWRLVCRTGATDGPAAHRGEHHSAVRLSDRRRAEAPRRRRQSPQRKAGAAHPRQLRTSRRGSRESCGRDHPQVPEYVAAGLEPRAAGDFR